MRFGRYSFRVLPSIVLLTVCAAAQAQQATRLAAVPQSKVVGRTFWVIDEAISLLCHATGERLDCSSESHLDVNNPAETATDVTLEVDPLTTQLEVNGVAIPLGMPEGQFVLTGQAMLPPGRSRIVVVIPKAVRAFTGAKSADLFTPVLVTRHPLLGQYPGQLTGAELTLQSVAATKRWKEVRRARITVVYPGDWAQLSGIQSCTTAEVTDSGCARKLNDGSAEIEWLSVASEGNSEPLSRVLTLAPTVPPLANGGLLLGGSWGGGGGCLGCSEAVRARVGYEVGINSWGLLALAGEVSPSQRVLFVPSLDYAILPNLRFIPATTVGVGLPVLVSPEFNVGFRGQASVMWPIGKLFSLGIVGTFDVFVGADGMRTPLGIGLQIGL